jgi:hypothetical protein
MDLSDYKPAPASAGHGEKGHETGQDRRISAKKTARISPRTAAFQSIRLPFSAGRHHHITGEGLGH